MIDGLDKVEDGSDTLWNTLRRAFLCMVRDPFTVDVDFVTFIENLIIGSTRFG